MIKSVEECHVLARPEDGRATDVDEEEGEEEEIRVLAHQVGLRRLLVLL
jgi:hypothetical protein